MKLFKGADVYAPESLGINDVLIAGGKVQTIGTDLSSYEVDGIDVEYLDGKLLVPGYVDSLVHITGGGGEGGYATRTPEMQINDAVSGGVTTVIGVLGTDSITRSLENLLAKSHALEESGISVFNYTGSYHIPAVTVTGSITKDIMLIEKFIGIGEVAIADHRGSQLSVLELARLASEARVGGMLSKKAGIVSVHVGDASDGLSILHEVADQTDIPISQFYPTHINRSQSLLEQGIKLAKVGGFIDFTTSTNEQILASGEIKAAQALAICLSRGIDVAQLTMSSDGNASLPVFDSNGKLIDLQVGEVRSLHGAFVEAVKVFGVELSQALTSITKSPADILKLTQKGRMLPGVDADICILDKASLAIEAVYAKGVRLL